MKGMILAAGLGTRLKPFTLKHPKALLTINGKTLLQRNIEYLKNYNITDIIINIHHFADQILYFLEKHHFSDCQITISDESHELLETGGAILKAKDFLRDSPFVLLNADILTHLDLKSLITYHQKHNTLATLAVSKRNSSRQLEFDDNMNLCGWKNLNTKEHISSTCKAKHELAFSGIHIIQPKLLDLITETGKFSIIKTYLRLMHQHNIKGFDHSGIEILDVGKPQNITKAELLFK